MKRYIAAILPALLLAGACHKPEYVPMTADRQGLTSLTAIFTTGPYIDQDLATLFINDPEMTDFVIPIPYYFPETSDDPTHLYMTRLRVKAQLQPNYRIEPALSILDLTEVNKFVLIDPEGNRKNITISGERRKSAACDLVTFMVDDVMVSGIINKSEKTILIPYKEDLSSVKVSGQVSPHATLSKIGSKPYVATSRYNLNTGATVTVLADDGVTEGVYTVSQGDPELVDMGLVTKSIEPLFNVDPVSMLGLPDYGTLAYISLAGNGSSMVVCAGDGSDPILVNKFNGAKTGKMTLGGVKADAIASDEKEHILVSTVGAHDEEVKIYVTPDTKTAPTLLYSFTNDFDVPVGHRIKVLGDVASEAVIVLTAEGIAGVTTTAKAVTLKVSGGAVTGMTTQDFSSLGFGWGPAPVGHATVVPASLTPDKEGYFLDYYESNDDPELSTDTSADAYILHYVNGKGQDKHVDHIGNWACNPNCLDLKTFNGARYMVLFVVSHFPQWGTGPRMVLYEVTDPESPIKIVDEQLKWTQKGDYNGEIGASGDVAICPSADGFRLFVFYYDHHSQSLGAYVADCIKQ